MITKGVLLDIFSFTIIVTGIMLNKKDNKL